jgi:hypothetical protein
MVAMMASAQVLMWSLWAGMALLTLGLVVLMRTRWGRSRPLHKCALLSLLAHGLFFAYAATVQIVSSQRLPPSSDEPLQMTSVVVDEPAQQPPMTQSVPRWEQFAATPDLPPHVSPPPAAAALQEAFVPLADGLIGPVVEALPEVRSDAELEHAPLALRDAGGGTTPSEALPASELDSAPPPQRQPDPDALGNAPRVDRPEEPRAPDAPPLPATLASTLRDIVPPALRRSEAVLVDDAQAPLAAEEASALPTAAPATASDSGAAADGGHAPPVSHQRWSEPSVAGSMQHVSTLPEAQLPSATQLPPPAVARRTLDTPLESIPAALRMRVAPDRLQLVQQQGGSEATERAVERALAWLAANQETDGRWSVRRHGGGQEQRVLGHDRQGAGGRADTAITALALLAFLGAGHTHLSGEHRQAVDAGLRYLLRMQDAATGHLAGDSEMYAHMYAHGMATLALGEACSLSGDERLREPLRRAIGYTLAAQHPSQGGWRYRPGDVQGDTSQLGWQLMALRSAELAGLEFPLRSRQGAERFLASVAAGPRRGLASYRAGERPSRTMTAEALFCRQLLGLAADRTATDEAEQYLLSELPGQGPTNYYYWYYATLALYQAQGKAWQQWNTALQATLLQSQETSGTLQGSWPANSVWGGYGGRVYSTALACLCLEVYYRYLPLYAHLAAEPAGSHTTPR